LSSSELRKLSPHRLFEAVAIVLVLWGLTSPSMIFQPSLFGDDASYVAHAMTIGIDLDLDYSNEIATTVRERPSGVMTPTHPIGPGLLAAPFVGAFSLVDRALREAVIDDREHFGGTWSILGFFVASSGALLVGAALYLQAFGLLDVKLSRRFALLLLGGTGVAFYGLNRFTMGHSFEFATAALVFWAAVALSTAGHRRGLKLALLAAGVVLSLLIRPANVNIVLLPVIIAMFLRAGEIQQSPLITRREAGRFALTASAAIAVLLMLNQTLYGYVLPNRSQMYGSRSRGVLDQFIEVVLALPSLRYVLLSSEYGTLYFMAVVPVGITLLAATAVSHWQCGSSRLLTVSAGLLTALYIAVPVAVVLIWQTHARSYGYRYLFSLIPIGMLGVALWWRRPTGRSHPWVKRLLGALSFFGVAGQVFFQTAPSLRPGRGTNAFGVENYSHAALGYAQAVLEAIVNPALWVQAGVMRVPGFVGGLLLGPERTDALAQTLGFAPLVRVSSGIEVSPLVAFEWFAQAAPGVPVATVILTVAVLPAAFLVLSRETKRRAKRTAAS
jgi:hypothetical protein